MEACRTALARFPWRWVLFHVTIHTVSWAVVVVPSSIFSTMGSGSGSTDTYNLELITGSLWILTLCLCLISAFLGCMEYGCCCKQISMAPPTHWWFLYTTYFLLLSICNVQIRTNDPRICGEGWIIAIYLFYFLFGPLISLVIVACAIGTICDYLRASLRDECEDKSCLRIAFGRFFEGPNGEEITVIRIVMTLLLFLGIASLVACLIVTPVLIERFGTPEEWTRHRLRKCIIFPCIATASLLGLGGALLLSSASGYEESSLANRAARFAHARHALLFTLGGVSAATSILGMRMSQSEITDEYHSGIKVYGLCYGLLSSAVVCTCISIMCMKRCKPRHSEYTPLAI